jgi:hypothetical protein
VGPLGPPAWQDLLPEFRTEEPGIDPVTALLALLDAAALDVVVRPDAGHDDARLLLHGGTEVLATTAARLGIAAPPIRTAVLTEDGFADGLIRLRESGYIEQTYPSDAWERFARLRRSYAPLALSIGRRVGSPVAPWMGEHAARAEPDPVP